jgi:hypothetical protein
MAAASLEREERVELELVQRWRFDELVRAGYTIPDALELAVHTEIDLHWAAGLVRSGCPSGTALRIAI